MSDFGPKVSRTLDAFQRAFSTVVFQAQKPPLDSEINLVSQVASEELKNYIRANMHSGFLLDPTTSKLDFVTDPLDSNQFFFGLQKLDDNDDPEELAPIIWGIVNGWVVPVVGSSVAGEGLTTNRVRLNPPPETGSRIDMVFLEVWEARIAANPSISNKPSQDMLWKHGNVEFGGTNLVDDLHDPAINYETTERIQVQYRIRVYGGGPSEASVALDKYPDGLGDPNITAQGPLECPSTSAAAQYINMREELGDPSMWRAGDGDPDNDLRTVDGYIYAIPIATVFRRNSTPFFAANLSGSPNQNGAFNRLPSSSLLADPRDGATKLSQVTLAQVLSVTDNTLDIEVDVDGLSNSGLDDPSHTLASVFITIGDEIMGISNVDTNSIPAKITIPAGGRGRGGTDISNHLSGDNVVIFSTRPDGVYSDQVTKTDVLDLRRGVIPGDWDYERILLHNIAQLARGELQTTWKQSGVPGGDTQGLSVVEVDTMLQDGATAVPNGTEAVDGLDGIRTVFSDAAVVQSDVTVMCDNEPTINQGFVASFDGLVTWDAGADFKPSGFMNNLSGAEPGFKNGSTIFLYIGGDTGNVGARKTFRDGSTRAVRFVAPQEHWKTDFPDDTTGLQHPVTLRWVSSDNKLGALSPPPTDILESLHPGPLYPLKSQRFTKPFLVLGGLLNPIFQVQNLNTDTQLINKDTIRNLGEIRLPGFDFDNFGDFYTTDSGGFSNRPECVAFPLLREQRTLYGMLTDDGKDTTGASSQVYLITYGDDGNVENNGAFRVVGAGTVGYTKEDASTTDGLVVEFITPNKAASVSVQLDAGGATPFVSHFVFTSPIGGGSLLAGNVQDPANNLYQATNNVAQDVANIVAVMNDPAFILSEIYEAVDASPNVIFSFKRKGVDGNDAVVDIEDASFTPTGPTSFTGGGSEFVNDPAKFVTAEIRSQFTNSEDGEGSSTGPSSLSITLTDLSGEFVPASPWSAFRLVQPFNTKLIINSTLLYHPGRGATTRVVDDVIRFAVSNPSSEYLRQSPAVLDPAFPAESGIPGDPAEISFDPVSVQVWNRLPSLGLPAPFAPNLGGNVVASSEQDREHELFLDTGSKTVIFRPFQRKLMTVQALTVGFTGNTTLYNPALYPDPALRPDAPVANTPKDDAQIFTTGNRMAYAVPPEYMPRFGRQDIPYFQDNGPTFGGLEHLEGINHLFTDSSDLSSPVFFVIGGEDNQGPGNLVTPMFIQTGISSGFNYGMHGTITGPNVPAYQGRLTTDVGFATPEAANITNRMSLIVSSDLGRGFKGIMMPPYLGTARVYGVYDRRDFVDVAGGVTYASDRVTPVTGRAINLMKRDATQQTLFILEDGAKDITGISGTPTYIIPENALDITRSPSYVDGEKFEDLEYVVECSVFGFAHNFITGNNYVLCRRHSSTAVQVLDGDNPELENIPMTIPAAGPDSDRVYVESLRTVYQGDPYMTRDGNNRVVSDYEARYGQISVPNMYELNFAIQQFDSAGDTIPQIPNDRPLEVLATVDFYTTLGTGKIGGKLFPGTSLDVGYTENTPEAASRKPVSVGEPPFKILTRTFTESQNEFNTTRAQAVLRVIDNYADGEDEGFEIFPPEGNSFKFTPNNGPTTSISKYDVSSADPVTIANEIHQKIIARSGLQSVATSIHDLDSTRLSIVAVPVGAEGNGISIAINDINNLDLLVAQTGDATVAVNVTRTTLLGGVDLNINAGDGTTQLRLNGMTERLPMGILLQDSDFLGENPLNDNASALQMQSIGLRPVQSLLPLTRDGGEEYSRFLGDPGEFVGLSDGAILQYQSFKPSTPGGTKKFRLYRGGGSSFMLTDPEPGGPIDWVSGSLPPSSRPILKGGLLACKALLVRNYVEKAFSEQDVTTQGDEIQMVIMTSGVLGAGKTQVEGVDLSGVVSPTGYGEGYAAVDRYRLEGKPMYKGRNRVAPSVEQNDLALFQEEPLPTIEECPVFVEPPPD